MSEHLPVTDEGIQSLLQAFAAKEGLTDLPSPSDAFPQDAKVAILSHVLYAHVHIPRDDEVEGPKIDLNLPAGKTVAAHWGAYLRGELDIDTLSTLTK